MNSKKALVLTYHVKNCTRVGGFHHFIDFLCRDGFEVDWVTVTVSSTWLLNKNDRENARNFIDLCKGIEFEQSGAHVRHFTAPVWIPARVAKRLHLKVGEYYWPKWEKLKKKLAEDYGTILVEGTACQYSEELRKTYPNSRILYRPSDILCMFSNVPNPEHIEKKMVDAANITLCVDETGLKYYKRIAGEDARVEILRNPITTQADIQTLLECKPKREDELVILYIGVSYINVGIVEYAAKQNKNATFVMVGPLGGVSHDNVVYTGMLTEQQYTEYLKKACIGINPLNPEMIHGEKGIAVGYTRKIINYMKYLMPVVATCSSNYLGIDGFYCVDSKEEFSKKITECLSFTIEDRERLRDGYLYAMQVFSEDESRKHFLSIVHGDSDK